MNIVAVSYIHVSILSFKIDLEEKYQDENVSRLGYGTVNDLNIGCIKKSIVSYWGLRRDNFTSAS